MAVCTPSFRDSGLVYLQQQQVCTPSFRDSGLVYLQQQQQQQPGCTWGGGPKESKELGM